MSKPSQAQILVIDPQNELKFRGERRKIMLHTCNDYKQILQVNSVLTMSIYYLHALFKYTPMSQKV